MNKRRKKTRLWIFKLREIKEEEKKTGEKR